MPSSRVGLPSDWWVPSIRRGIIRESALCRVFLGQRRAGIGWKTWEMVVGATVG